MPVLQVAWLYYLNNPALVLNGLALFYGLAGGWLWLATQLRSARATARLATSPAVSGEATIPAATQRINRMFYAVGGVCLLLATLLTLASTQF
ncbi:hypothetical protein HG264_08165 [Pseudomonas sp. gcc21]|uniref:hypothetical protein n=1 Tax=Pseudomonas sp. gcc21 TaxID=2726989 RepID=UPI001451103B|nr:hypothetical protein [Pseudomonas sp. gcc21]QJD58887.1 hypothetical protein HG264_08165 [Pseudomonas sp. gcc21]